ncbi:lytic polysaccharide monooxygenase [Vitiosangium sp. GDMCC 1.1324]|uniref:lytic polysaccharide monooxygenase n=1 Tax=Vitiosangium sp. (strain GDMCC 1.1324) TaxID=2138576 RepID=UPI000D389146|nr:lytic polysaccharide monooxygenase [Vitiosangium sp. GDMCC 1.1324]PTL83731.1 cellulose-binding protein [Vitiosangium sp. GDMCC 1.1324]
MRKQSNGVSRAAVFGLATLGAVLVPMGDALAHGGMTYPATRTYACYLDGKAGGQGGDLQPTNPACIAAVAEGGKNPLWNWFGNLISNAAGRHREIIPDGKLCGPTPLFDAYNMAHADWPSTQLEAGSTITLRYNAWAPHPGTWYQYVTRDGWDPSQPLKWSDLEPAPFNTVTNPPINGSGPEGPEYTWSAQLPAGKSGRHIIYSIWQRSDSAEAFYNCSDVVFDNGEPDTEAPTAPGTPTASGVTGTTAQLQWSAAHDNVGVTGYEVYRAAGSTGELVASPGGTSFNLTGLTPSTPYTVYVVARDAAGNRSAASPAVTFTTTPTPPIGNCSVAYSEPNKWYGGFTGNVTITNTGTSTISGWTLQWDYTGGQTVTQGWSAKVSQQGTAVTAQNEAWTANLPPNGSVSFGFNANSPASNPPAPSVFTLNGTVCTTL